MNTGGVAIDTVVTDGLLGVAGVASNTLVLKRGTEQVGYGGVTIGTTIEAGNSLNSGGLLWVFSGGVASDTTVSGGTFELAGAGVASAVATLARPCSAHQAPAPAALSSPTRPRRRRPGGTVMAIRSHRRSPPDFQR